MVGSARRGPRRRQKPWSRPGPPWSPQAHSGRPKAHCIAAKHGGAEGYGATDAKMAPPVGSTRVAAQEVSAGGCGNRGGGGAAGGGCGKRCSSKGRSKALRHQRSWSHRRRSLRALQRDRQDRKDPERTGGEGHGLPPKRSKGLPRPTDTFQGYPRAFQDLPRSSNTCQGRPRSSTGLPTPYKGFNDSQSASPTLTKL